jgi:hypothetical protein
VTCFTSLNVARSCGLVFLRDFAPKEGIRFQKEIPRFVALSACDVWFAGVKRNKLQPKDVSGKLVKFCVNVNTGVPLATEPGISLIILPLMRVSQRNLKRTYLTSHNERTPVQISLQYLHWC